MANCGITEPHEWHRGCDGVEPSAEFKAAVASSGLAEVWCSECDQPSATEREGRAYCLTHADMAGRIIAAYIEHEIAAKHERAEAIRAKHGYDLSLPSPESIARAAREGTPAL